MITLAGPIGAPSANKFCHISPVNPKHVQEDFKEYNIDILDGGISNFCLESTVVRPNCKEKLVEILRKGILSKTELQECLNKNDKFKDYKVEFLAKVNKEQVNTEKPDNDNKFEIIEIDQALAEQLRNLPHDY